MTTQEATTCPRHCRFSDSYPVLSEAASERYPIRIDVKYNVQDFIDQAMWRTSRIKDNIIDQCERMRREGELSEEQVTYQETFDPDIEDFHLEGDEITFHFGYERRCGFITNEGVNVYEARGSFPESRVPYRDRCGGKERNHVGIECFGSIGDHDFEPYPVPVPNEG